MPDDDLSRQLHSLAETADELPDLPALRERMPARARRRAAARIGVAGAGVVALAGGLFVASEHRHGAAETAVRTVGPVAFRAAPAAPPAAPACDTVLADLRAAGSTPDAGAVKDPPRDASDSVDELGGHGFKGIVTIIAIDGPRVTFRNDEPEATRPTSGVGTLDAATIWVDGRTRLDSPPALQVGQQLGLATTQDSAGVDHIAFVDVSARAGDTPREKAAPPAGAPTDAVDRDAKAAAKAGERGVTPGPQLPPGPTAKSMATITAVDATSITVTLDDEAEPERTAAIDLATTPFYAGDATCVPGTLTVGQAIGVAYHFDDVGNLDSDSAMLVP